MRILFVSHEVGYSFGVYLRVTSRALVARGHDVHILHCSPFGPKQATDEFEDGVWIHHRRHIQLRGTSRLRALPPVAAVISALSAPAVPAWTSPLMRVTAAISNLIEYRQLGFTADVIEAPEHLAEGLGLALFGRPPVVVEFHGPLGVVLPASGIEVGWHMRVADRLERLGAKAADVTVAPSAFISWELLAAGWTAARRSVVVPHSIDVDAWAEVPGASASPAVVLSVGEVSPLKGADVLIRAAALLTDSVPDLEVVFVGPAVDQADGTSSHDSMATLADDLGVRCRFTGAVPREALVDWYGLARVVAVASRFDSFSQVGLEALAAGRPVVCSDRAGLAELASGGEGLTVVPAGDPAALAAGLQPYLLDAIRAETAGQAGRALVQDRCTPAAVAAAKEQVYLAAIDQARHRLPLGRSRAGRRNAVLKSTGYPLQLNAVGQDLPSTPLVFVTGMHRSGTSLTAGVLELLGIAFGPHEGMLEPGEENPHGFWEHLTVTELNDEILEALGGTWDQPPVLLDGWHTASELDPFRPRVEKLLGEIFHGLPRGGLKDPRVSLLMPLWSTPNAGASSVLMLRDPWEVATSMSLRGDRVSPERAAYLWLRYVVGAWRNDPRHLRLDYARFFEDLDGTLETLRNFVGLEAPSSENLDAITALVDPGSRRSTPVQECGPMMTKAMELYEVARRPGIEADRIVDQLQLHWARRARLDHVIAMPRRRLVSLIPPDFRRRLPSRPRFGAPK